MITRYLGFIKYVIGLTYGKVGFIKITLLSLFHIKYLTILTFVIRWDIDTYVLEQVSIVYIRLAWVMGLEIAVKAVI